VFARHGAGKHGEFEMRYQIGETGKNGRNESWYFVEYEAETGTAFWVHKWNNLSHSLQMDEGEERLPLEEASKKHFYDEALKQLQENHPEWQAIKA
jgi:hypothetical protein